MTITELQDLNTTEALSKYTGISIPTLQRWRARGEGPKYVKLGHLVRYPKVSVEAWIADRFAEVA